MKIPIVKLTIPQKIIDQVGEVLKSGYWVDGSKVHQLERDFAQFCGVKYCRAVCNGTAALMTMMGALDLGPGDEVIVPSFSFIATANSIKSVGAKPVFAEINPDTFTLNPTDVQKKITPKTKAIMPVHLYGLCADMQEFQEIAEKNSIFLLEDAAQAHGAMINNKKSGSFGIAGGFSLYPTKNMFAGGEGGLITTNNEEIYEKIKLYMNHGQSQKYHHSSLGFNFRMAEVNAIVAQYALSQIETWNSQRYANATLLSELLKDISSIQTPFVPTGFTHVFHQYTIKTKNRKAIIESLEKENIGYGIHYGIPIHLQEYYQKIGYSNVSLSTTEQIAKEVLSLPIHPNVSSEQIQFLAKIIRNTLQ